MQREPGRGPADCSIDDWARETSLPSRASSGSNRDSAEEGLQAELLDAKQR
jgi:hypothetical protein